jgi:hypothetical protein
VRSLSTTPTPSGLRAPPGDPARSRLLTGPSRTATMEA